MYLRRHIALFVPSLRGGGAERVMVLLANSLAERGHQIDLVLVSAAGPYLDEVAAQVRIVDLGRKRVLTSLWPLARYLRRNRPDAMLSAMTHANLIAIWARMLAGTAIRLVASEHNSPSQTLGINGLAFLTRLLISLFYPRVDAVVCVSNEAREEMALMFPTLRQKLRTIYNPHDVKLIHNLMEYPPDHPWLGYPGIPVILAVGRLTAQKDYPTLLRAMKHILQNRAVRLIILGHGEEETALRQLARELGIAKHVDFCGFQKNPYAWMRCCDLYVMSSAWEGLPGTLIEALICGAKVVSTNCRTGPAEILEDGKWGSLVPVGDASALARAVQQTLDAPQSQTYCPRIADFEPNRISQAYEEVLL